MLAPLVIPPPVSFLRCIGWRARWRTCLRLLLQSECYRPLQVYSFDKVGEREPLAEQEASITRSVLTLVATGTQVKT